MTLGQFWPLVAKKAKKLAFVISKKCFLGFSSLLRPKMTMTNNAQKNPIYKKMLLSFMTLVHFWPLVAEKLACVGLMATLA